MKIDKTKPFSQLDIGDQFYTEKYLTSYPYNSVDKFMFTVWTKVDNSHAKCINQFGYGNKRHVGTINPFAPNRVTFIYSLKN